MITGGNHSIFPYCLTILISHLCSKVSSSIFPFLFESEI